MTPEILASLNSSKHLPTSRVRLASSCGSERLAKACRLASAAEEMSCGTWNRMLACTSGMGTSNRACDTSACTCASNKSGCCCDRMRCISVICCPLLLMLLLRIGVGSPSSTAMASTSEGELSQNCVSAWPWPGLASTAMVSQVSMMARSSSRLASSTTGLLLVRRHERLNRVVPSARSASGDKHPNRAVVASADWLIASRTWWNRGDWGMPKGCVNIESAEFQNTSEHGNGVLGGTSSICSG